MDTNIHFYTLSTFLYGIELKTLKNRKKKMFYAAVALFIVIGTIITIKKREQEEKKRRWEKHRTELDEPGPARKSNDIRSKYKSKKPLSNIEQITYWKLVEAVNNEKIVLSQVAFSSFIRTEGDRSEAISKFYKARQKVADFVICNKDFSISAIVEIDDKTHNKEKDEARDAMTKEAGIRTVRFEAKNLPTMEEIRKELLS